MAMQAGMGLSKVLILIGAGYTGSIMLRNGKLSDILGELQSMLKEKSGEKSDGDSDYAEALSGQVRRLALEVRQLASARKITVLNGNSGEAGNITALAVPAATLAALGYGYMWWKGISLSDLMYVTKRGMVNAVSSMETQLKRVSNALDEAKKLLTQRIQNLDGKLDEQKEMSTEIRSEVTDARNRLETIGFDLNHVQHLVWGLNEKVDSMEDKQDFSCAGIAYMLNFLEERGAKLPDCLQDVPKSTGKHYYVNREETPSLKGLQHLAEAMESKNPDGSRIGVGLQSDLDSSRKSVNRSLSIKVVM